MELNWPSLPFSVRKKRQNGGRLTQTAHVSRPLPLQWGPTFTGIGGEGSLQFVWRTDLELDLKRTQNYCVELFALYLRRMII